MRPLVLCAVTCSALVIALHAQGPVVPKPRTPPPSSSDRVRDVQQPLTVEGCISGTRLRYDREHPVNTEARLLDAKEFILEGPRELMQQIKAAHEGHEDQIIGTVIIPPSHQGDTLTTTRRIGKTTISGGTRQETKDPEAFDEKGQRPLRLKVTELRHVRERCSPLLN